jgi:hypothetical protein
MKFGWMQMTFTSWFFGFNVKKKTKEVVQESRSSLRPNSSINKTGMSVSQEKTFHTQT